MKDWPGSATIALICCRKGDPFFKTSPNVLEMKCYCCDETIMVSENNQHNKVHLKSSELICINCWSEKYSESTQLLIRQH